MDTDTLSEKTRQELAKLRVLASKLARNRFNADDPEAQELAEKIMAIAVALCQEAEQDSPLPAVSTQAVGLEVPLHLLDTTANRRYLAALVEAHRAALEVDRERGYGEDGPAQDLEDLVAEVRMEIYGPDGG